MSRAVVSYLCLYFSLPSLLNKPLSLFPVTRLWPHPVRSVFGAWLMQTIWQLQPWFRHPIALEAAGNANEMIKIIRGIIIYILLIRTYTHAMGTQHVISVPSGAFQHMTREESIAHLAIEALAIYLYSRNAIGMKTRAEKIMGSLMNTFLTHWASQYRKCRPSLNSTIPLVALGLYPDDWKGYIFLSTMSYGIGTFVRSHSGSKTKN